MWFLHHMIITSDHIDTVANVNKYSFCLVSLLSCRDHSLLLVYTVLAFNLVLKDTHFGSCVLKGWNVWNLFLKDNTIFHKNMQFFLLCK